MMFAHVPAIDSGAPQCLEEALALARADGLRFRHWVLAQLQARPLRLAYGRSRALAARKPAIDGMRTFVDPITGVEQAALVQIRDAPTTVGDVGALRDVVEATGAAIATLIILEWPGPALEAEAVAAGYYETWLGKYARLQIISVVELLRGRRVDMPSGATIQRSTMEWRSRWCPRRREAWA